ncbi:unnamed protein product, partial [Gulo gulo]
SHSQECALCWRGEETSSLTGLILWHSVIYSSRVQLLVLFRRQVRPIWWGSLKTPTCKLSMSNVSQLCQKTSS